jgi:hypothetical protein
MRFFCTKELACCCRELESVNADEPIFWFVSNYLFDAACVASPVYMNRTLEAREEADWLGIGGLGDE